MSSSVLESRLLNDEQRRAVSIVEGPLLVIAGAGSGKTLTLTHRAAYMVERGIPPEGILLLTFTRRAAHEMLRRAAGLLDGRCERIAGGTFHSFAHHVLRREGQAVGCPPGFTILDRSDSEEIFRILRSEMGLAEKERRFPKSATLADLASKCVNCAIPLEKAVEREIPQFLDDLGDLEKIVTAYGAYKERHSLLDYDDLLVRLARLVTEDDDARTRLSRRYVQIQVDEYQDTNLLQARILRKLAACHDNVMVVGDDCQSIYSFRGARVANILEFPKEYPRTRIVKLQTNYRSTQPVLDLANAVVVSMERKYEKILSSVRGAGARPTVLRGLSERDLSSFIVRSILEHREEGADLSQIAVLFRSSYQSFELEMELARANIPFVKWGGIQLMETAHLKDCIAFLRSAANVRDRISWLRMLRLVDGIGEKTAAKIARELMEESDPASVLPLAPAPKKSKKGLADLAALLRSIAGKDLPPSRAVERVLEFYGPILQERYPEDAAMRRRDLEQFQSIASRYKTLEQFLADLALDPVTDSVKGADPGSREEDPLVLSTIHSAKGLEWSVVFVIGLVEGRFPALYAGEDPEAMDEERRLFYVACTRARDHLYLAYPAYHFERTIGSVLSRPSRFLEELPPLLYREMEAMREFPSDGRYGAAEPRGGYDYAE